MDTLKLYIHIDHHCMPFFSSTLKVVLNIKKTKKNKSNPLSKLITHVKRIGYICITNKNVDIKIDAHDAFLEYSNQNNFNSLYRYSDLRL